METPLEIQSEDHYKKLIFEYGDVIEEFTQKVELINTNIPRFMNQVQIFLDENPDIKSMVSQDGDPFIPVEDEEPCKEINSEVEIPLESNGETALEKNLIQTQQGLPRIEEDGIDMKKLKNLYRKIVKLTHPDRTMDTNLNNIYINATKFYNEGDLESIFLICIRLDIDFEIQPQEVEVLDKKVKDYKLKSKFLDSNLALIWYNSREPHRIVIEYVMNQIQYGSRNLIMAS
jgi:hypothetical protein